MRALLLGFLIPEEVFEWVVETDSAMPAQTHRFGWSLAKALQSAGIHVQAVSAAPVVDYPYNPKIRFQRALFSEANVDGVMIAFINLPGFKHLTRFVNAWRGASTLSGRVTPDVIVVHGVHSPFLWVAAIMSRSLGVPMVVVLTDQPSQKSKFDSAISSWMKVLDSHLIARAMKRVDGVVSLTDALASKVAPRAPVMILEGIARPLELSGNWAIDTNTLSVRNVVYAGGLYEEYGVLDLIDAVALSKREWTLTLYGKGPLENVVRDRAAVEPRIRVVGMVSARDLARVYASADLLVNPRPSGTDLDAYAFPSKLLEYIASGTPVLTTRLRSIPADYYGRVFGRMRGRRGWRIRWIVFRTPMQKISACSAGRRENGCSQRRARRRKVRESGASSNL